MTAGSRELPRQPQFLEISMRGWQGLGSPGQRPAMGKRVLRFRAQPALPQCSLFSWKPIMHTMHATSSAQTHRDGKVQAATARNRLMQKPCSSSSILGESSSARAPERSGALDLPKMEQSVDPWLHQQLPKVTPRARHGDGGEQLCHPAVQPPWGLVAVETRDGRQDTWGRTSSTSTTTCHCSW